MGVVVYSPQFYNCIIAAQSSTLFSTFIVMVDKMSAIHKLQLNLQPYCTVVLHHLQFQSATTSFYVLHFMQYISSSTTHCDAQIVAEMCSYIFVQFAILAVHFQLKFVLNFINHISKVKLQCCVICSLCTAHAVEPCPKLRVMQ